MSIIRALRAAAKRGTVFAAPKRGARPFSADYPRGVASEIREATPNAGRIVEDIEGRPLSAPYVAGRRVLEGEDQALSASELNAIAEAATSGGVTRPSRSAIGGDHGRFVARRVGDHRQRDIFVAHDLPEASAQQVLAHELGHALADLAPGFSVAGSVRDARRIFHQMNSPEYRHAASRNLETPASHGYSSAQVEDELIAEALRAYLTAPNYIKTEAPALAASIRRHFNSHPIVSRIVQFNAAPMALGGGLAGALANSERGADV